MRSALCMACVAAGLAMLPAAANAGDLFRLVGGGQLEGELLNPTQTPRTAYHIRLPHGEVVLPADQVTQVLARSAAERDYAELLPKMPRTVDGMWTMAEWCRERELVDQRRRHLEELLTLDPDHRGARAALGYTRIDDRWVITNEWRAEQGFVRVGAVWRLPQEAKLEEQRRQFDLDEKKWQRDLKLWRGQIGGRRGEQALANLKGVRDPAAAQGVADLLEKETLRDMQSLFVDLLGRLIENPKSVSALVKFAVEHTDDRVRDLCIEELRRQEVASSVGAFVKLLEAKDNALVNRAGVALARVGDERAIVPLIEALTTKHKQVVQGGGGGPGNLGASFSPRGPGGLSVGGGPKVVEQEVKNRAVFEALVSLAGGGNFGYDKEAWKQWYAARSGPPNFNLRRDD